MANDSRSGVQNPEGAYPTKAMILAAGQGTRLRPLTDHVPKCMVAIRGKPLLEYTLEWLCRYGVSHIVINVCHLPEVIQSYFGNGTPWGVRITYSREESPLGTAGGVKKAASFFDGPFYVWYGDNLSTCRLDRLYDYHRAKGGLATVALHFRDDPTQSGIVDTDKEGRILRFLEKPRHDQVFSYWVSGGILVLELPVLRYIPETGTPDFGRDVLPALLSAGQPLYGYRLSSDEGLWWIDTPEDLRRLQERMVAPVCDRRLSPLVERRCGR